MYVINARNVNDAFEQGMSLLNSGGVWQNSRAGEVLVMPAPVVTCYKNPIERVLFHPQRDANPVFHLMEALWMLAGRRDAVWLDQFRAGFSKDFAEGDGLAHGAYGYRWRQHFDMEWSGPTYLPDQLSSVVHLLSKNPDDRRVVLAMWDPLADLGVSKKDIPCNTHVYFRVREEFNPTYVAATDHGFEHGGTIDRVLDMTVCCRSNDIIWGAYGSNAVHFAILQEYIAARVGVGIGTYYQLSNNFHAYRSVLEKFSPFMAYKDPYVMETVNRTKIVTYPDTFDRDLELFFGPDPEAQQYQNPFFTTITVPFREFYGLWRQKQYRELATTVLNRLPLRSDWVVAVSDWAARRMSKLEATE